MNAEFSPSEKRAAGVRWWPAILIVLAATARIVWVRLENTPFQARNLQTLFSMLVTLALLFIWWLTFSRTRWKLRLAVAAGVICVIGLATASFRIRGVSGDLLPILEPRWAKKSSMSAISSVPAARVSATNNSSRSDFPQFLGPHRTATLDGPALDSEWAAHPPQILWRQPIGAAWSGFVIIGDRALTQEQNGEEERVTCYDLLTGKLLWAHGDAVHYNTVIAGEGPRCTPTVVSNRVFTLGATGILNCLDLAIGKSLWTHSITNDASSRMPEWGFSGSPLVVDGLVAVSAGGNDKSLLAYRDESGELAWAGGTAPVNHGSPFIATLAGVRQILAFNSKRITAHDVATGRVLWEYPWGVGQPHVAVPVVASSNRVLFSSGYGVGSELLEISPVTNGTQMAQRVWASKKMKAKFANLVQRNGFLYGLDDGIFACVDLADGSQRWKEGRYGHGQGLLVRELFLLMTENGELVLLRPTPDAPNELHRFRVFNSKTWNPIALAGDLFLVRNDQEAACLRLPLKLAER